MVSRARYSTHVALKPSNSRCLVTCSNPGTAPPVSRGESMSPGIDGESFGRGESGVDMLLICEAGKSMGIALHPGHRPQLDFMGALQLQH